MKTKVIALSVFGGALLAGFLAVAFDWDSSTRRFSSRPGENNLSYAGARQTKTGSHEELEDVGIGFLIRKDRDCTIQEHFVVDADGQESVAIECVPNKPKAEHPYAQIPIEELKELAYRDSEAAEIVGIKLIKADQEEEGLEYIYRAVALGGGKSMRPLHRAHNTFYSSVMGSKYPYDQPPQYDVRSMKQAYVFDLLKQKLTGRFDGFIEAELIKAGYTDFAELQAMADAIVASMADIEIEVVGSQSIKEKTNV